MFRFKQFTIHQQRSAMKVGTDGVLLGSWVQCPQAQVHRLLDIGCGTGLIALMLAQRFATMVDAVEIDADAAQEASENVAESVFRNYVQVFCDDICRFDNEVRYDLIVCNPPYFVDSTKCPDAQRTKARHTTTLTAEKLLQASLRLLAEDGWLSVIYPVDEAQRFESLATAAGLFCVRSMNVLPTKEHAPKRRMMTFARKPGVCLCEELIIELSRNCYTEEYKRLTKEFYLKF